MVSRRVRVKVTTTIFSNMQGENVFSSPPSSPPSQENIKGKNRLLVLLSKRKVKMCSSPLSSPPFPLTPCRDRWQALNELKEAGEVDQVHEWVNEQGRLQRRLKKTRPGAGIVGPSGEEFCGLATGMHSTNSSSLTVFPEENHDFFTEL